MSAQRTYRGPPSPRPRAAGSWERDEAVRPRHAGNYTRWILIGSTLRASGGHFFESPVWRGSTGDRPKRARWPPYAPFCSDGIGLSVLPGASRLLGLAPVGCRRLTRSRVNVTAGRIILDAGCVVSAPLPALSGPPLARGHHSEGGGTFLSDPERPPSAVRGLLAGRTKCRALFGPAAVPAGAAPSCGMQKLFAAGRLHRPEEDPMRAGREEYGIRTLFVALVLALANGIVWFPVWSSGPEGTGMR